MKSAFERALDYTFANEGGFSNDAGDRGGATRWGIIRSEAAKWYGRPVSVEEMKSFPIEEAKKIYMAWYWKPLGCDKINDPGVAACMFDIGVVRGIGVPPKYAQTICNGMGVSPKLVEDGHIGPKTLAAINSVNADEFIRRFEKLSEGGFLAIVARNASQSKFLKGWMNRARRLLKLIPW